MAHGSGDNGGTPLRSQFEGDPDMAELVEMFVAELPQRVEAIVVAYRSGEADSIKRYAHQLKGASAGYGYPSIGDAAARVESFFRTASGSNASALQACERDLRELIELCSRAVNSGAAGASANLPRI